MVLSVAPLFDLGVDFHVFYAKIWVLRARILIKSITLLLELLGKRAKYHARFRSYHLSVDHLVMVRIITKRCCNNKTNLLCCFVDLIKYFGILSRSSLGNRLEEIKFLSELRDIVVLTV
jgi:hypothetical protein